MRIISPEKDYYDSVQSYGQDDIKFVRKNRRLDVTDNVLIKKVTEGRLHGEIKKGREEFYVETFSIYYLGNIYNGIEISSLNTRTYGNKTFFYTYEEFINFFGEEIDESRLVSRGWRFERSNFVKDWLKSYPFDLSEVFGDCYIAYIPGYMERLNYYKIEKYPILSKYDFQKVKDPYTIFQEIQMFLCNVANPEPVMVKISDKDLAYKRGHGDPYSFRKVKEK